MKTKTVISDINHEDLVDFLSTALYGSNFFGADYDVETYNNCPDKKEDDCYEDKMARILINGGKITVFDMYAEDEDDFYGNLTHSWDCEKRTMDYTVSLYDLKEGFQKCLDGTFKVNDGCDEEIPYMKKCMNNLINHDEGDLDLPQAENILQCCVFGQIVYG